VNAEEKEDEYQQILYGVSVLWTVCYNHSIVEKGKGKR
jgi:hypothetical protein